MGWGCTFVQRLWDVPFIVPPEKEHSRRGGRGQGGGGGGKRRRRRIKKTGRGQMFVTLGCPFLTFDTKNTNT